MIESPSGSVTPDDESTEGEHEAARAAAAAAGGVGIAVPRVSVYAEPACAAAESVASEIRLKSSLIIQLQVGSHHSRSFVPFERPGGDKRSLRYSAIQSEKVCGTSAASGAGPLYRLYSVPHLTVCRRPHAHVAQGRTRQTWQRRTADAFESPRDRNQKEKRDRVFKYCYKSRVATPSPGLAVRGTRRR